MTALVGGGLCVAGWAAELTDHRLTAAALFLAATMLFMESLRHRRGRR